MAALALHEWIDQREEVLREELPMLYYALMFLVVGLIAGALGLFGIAAIASQIAWVLFLIGVVLIVVHMIGGRRALP